MPVGQGSSLGLKVEFWSEMYTLYSWKSGSVLINQEILAQKSPTEGVPWNSTGIGYWFRMERECMMSLSVPDGSMKNHAECTPPPESTATSWLHLFRSGS